MTNSDPIENALTDAASSLGGNSAWLANELHDGLLQWVIGARMQIEAAMTKLDQSSPAAANINQANLYLLNALAESRTLIGFLSNEESAGCDVIGSVTSFLDSVRPLAADHSQTISLELPSPNWPALPKLQAWSIFRFVQQAVQNAIQHAGPTSISVNLGWDSSTELALIARIADQGLGFEGNARSPSGHYGMQSMQMRARACCGRFAIESTSGCGCQVSLVIPVSVFPPSVVGP